MIWTALRARSGLVAAAILLSAASARAQFPQEVTIVQMAGGPGPEIVLGHPVPMPIDTTAPMGFRLYARIVERLGELATEAFITQYPIGQSLLSRQIWALRISDADLTRDDGTPEPKVLFVGTRHAREWLSPEVVLRIVEHIQDEYDQADDNYLEFLVNNTELHVVVVMNPDGFVYTQSNPARAADFHATDFRFQNRDGRLRRKNLADHTDQSFDPLVQPLPVPCTLFPMAFEGLLGVDLNRNNSIGYGNVYPPRNNQSSADRCRLVYHGPAAPGAYSLATAQPETQRYANLVNTTLGADRLRGFVDYHAFGQCIIMNQTGNADRDALADQVRTQVRAAIARVHSRTYVQMPLPISACDDDTSSPTESIGAADEFVANTPRQPPAYTIELPPQTPTVQGFIPPTTLIGSVAEENIEGAKIMLDFAAGPPHLERALIWGDDDGDGDIDPDEVRYDGEWLPIAATPVTQRNLLVRVREWAKPETLRFLLQFSEPMKLDDGSGNPVELDGSMAADPTVSFRIAAGPTHSVAAGSWLPDRQSGAAGGPIRPGFAEYRFDTWEGSFTVPAGMAASFDSDQVTLRVDAMDLLGNRLDGIPETVADYDRQWVAFEDGETPANPNDGGVDVNHVFRIDTESPEVDTSVQK